MRKMSEEKRTYIKQNERDKAIGQQIIDWALLKIDRKASLFKRILSKQNLCKYYIFLNSGNKIGRISEKEKNT